MKKYPNPYKFPLKFMVVVLLMFSCKQREEQSEKNERNVKMPLVSAPKMPLSKEFKNYWYSGEAEITSYQLEQARYGEIRDGKAVLIYVTEPFLKDKQVKADESYPDNIPVLKLNSTKKFLTGIYPYSIMNSSFYPVYNNQHALKVTSSIQEWCGQVYTQINNRGNFEVTAHSYFEKEADQQIQLDKTTLENELWNQIRVNPESLPTGTIKLIPSLEYINLHHKELKSYSATITLTKDNGLGSYEIYYPELERTLKINFVTAFPYTIESWSETFKSGFGDKAKERNTKAIRIKTIKTPYWQKNGNSDLFLRDSLKL